MNLDKYDAGILNDYGGGKISWWHDYIRSELDRAYEYYQAQNAIRKGSQTMKPSERIDELFNSFGFSKKNFESRVLDKINCIIQYLDEEHET